MSGKVKNKRLLLFCFVGLMISCNSNQQTEKENADSLITDTLASNDNSINTNAADTTAAANRLASNTDWLLVPGVSAGGTKINENADSVYKRLGTPDGGDAAMQKAVAVWYAHHDTASYSTAIYTARNKDSGAVARVLQIRVTSPAFKTAEGIHVASYLEDIKKQFNIKRTEQYTDDDRKYDVYDSKQGIAFEMDALTGKCVAIIIHKAGVTGQGTYLKFRTTNRRSKK